MCCLYMALTIRSVDPNGSTKHTKRMHLIPVFDVHHYEALGQHFDEIKKSESNSVPDARNVTKISAGRNILHPVNIFMRTINNSTEYVMRNKQIPKSREIPIIIKRNINNFIPIKPYKKRKNDDTRNLKKRENVNHAKEIQTLEKDATVNERVLKNFVPIENIKTNSNNQIAQVKPAVTKIRTLNPIPNIRLESASAEASKEYGTKMRSTKSQSAGPPSQALITPGRSAKRPLQAEGTVLANASQKYSTPVENRKQEFAQQLNWNSKKQALSPPAPRAASKQQTARKVAEEPLSTAASKDTGKNCE